MPGRRRRLRYQRVAKLRHWSGAPPTACPDRPIRCRARASLPSRRRSRRAKRYLHPPRPMVPGRPRSTAKVGLKEIRYPGPPYLRTRWSCCFRQEPTRREMIRNYLATTDSCAGAVPIRDPVVVTLANRRVNFSPQGPIDAVLVNRCARNVTTGNQTLAEPGESLRRALRRARPHPPSRIALKETWQTPARHVGIKRPHRRGEFLTSSFERYLQ